MILMSESDRVINPSLYNRAKQAGDPPGVKVSMPKTKAEYVKKLKDDKVVGQLQRGQTGEKYVVCCPFCSDTRYRLTISYLYCSTVTENDGTVVHFGPIANCFNENCLQDPDKARRLNKILTGTKLDAAFHGFNLSEDDGVDAPQTTQLPDELITFKELGKEHPASKYLIDRGFSIEEMDYRGVRYCNKFSEWPIGEDRIFFPCHSMDTLEVIGGQAREYNHSENDIAPKDLTLPGTPISRGAFGMDENTIKGNYVIITEAPLDAIAAGHQAIASFGGTVNNWQVSRLISNFDFIIFLPDGDVRLNTNENGKLDIAKRIEHQIENINKVDTSNVAWVNLPKDKDPADLGRERVLEYIIRDVGKAGLLDEFMEAVE